MSAPKVMIYVQHLLGIGHIRRASVIAKAVAAAGGDCVFVSGGLPQPDLDLGGARLEQLPPAFCRDESFTLLDEAGENVFAEAADAPEGTVSDNLKHAIGGILDLMPAAMAILAPSANSFRRYRPNIFVPVSRSWAAENRSAALRIPVGGRAARRIEHRMAGADANPYLTLASMLAGLHYGLVNRIDPGPPSEGNAGEVFDPALPFRPRRALEAFAESAPMADYFGADYVKTYVACKIAELDKFEAIVSPAEYSWYL